MEMSPEQYDNLEELNSIIKKHTSEYHIPNAILKLIDPKSQKFWDDLLNWKEGK